MKKQNALAAILVILGIPALMLLQQFLMPRTKPSVPPHMAPQYHRKLFVATENSLEYGEKNAAVIALAIIENIKLNRMSEAEKFCRLGALEFRHPSIMVFYGDFLKGQKRNREALRWYKFARQQAKINGRREFLRIVEKKIKGLDPGAEKP